MRTIENAFFVNDFNVIGGVESWMYYLARKYRDRDIVVFYKTGHPDQIERLRKYVEVRKYDPGEEIRCRRAYYNYACLGIDTTKAEEYIYCIHADYVRQNIPFKRHEQLNRFIAVSRTAQESFYQKYGIESEIVHNPVVAEQQRKVLHLISATRLTREKGYDRMVVLANKLKRAGIPYIWTVFTNQKEIDQTLFCRKEPTLDIMPYISDADFLVQLSDSEASCYSVREALILKTPVIVTNIPTFTEMGVKDGENGFLLELDMSNVDVTEIYNRRLDFVPPKGILKDEWSSVLGRAKGMYDPNRDVEIVILRDYIDIMEGRRVKKGEKLTAPYIRGQMLQDKGLAKVKDPEDDDEAEEQETDGRV